MEKLINKLKKTDKKLFFIFGFLTLIVILMLSNTNKKEEKDIDVWKAPENTGQTDMATVVNKLKADQETQNRELLDQIEKSKNETMGSIKDIKKENILKEQILDNNEKILTMNNGDIIKVSTSGETSYLQKGGNTGEVLEEIPLPDGSKIQKTSKNFLFLVKVKDNSKTQLETYNQNKDGNFILKTIDGLYLLVTKDGIFPLTQDENGELYLNGKKIESNIINGNVFDKLDKVNEKIKEAIDGNGIKYEQRSDGVYKILPDGTAIKVGEKLSIDKNGNILIDGQNLGKATAIKKNENSFMNENGELVYEKIDPETGKKTLYKKDANGNEVKIGEGEITFTPNGLAVANLKSSAKEFLGLEINSFIDNNNNFYEVEQNKIYKNNELYTEGTLFVGKGRNISVMNNGKKVSDIGIASKYNLKTQEVITKNGDMFKVLMNGEIIKMDRSANISKLGKGELNIQNGSLTVNTDGIKENYEIDKTETYQGLANSETLLISMNNYYIKVNLKNIKDIQTYFKETTKLGNENGQYILKTFSKNNRYLFDVTNKTKINANNNEYSINGIKVSNGNFSSGKVNGSSTDIFLSNIGLNAFTYDNVSRITTLPYYKLQTKFLGNIIVNNNKAFAEVTENKENLGNFNKQIRLVIVDGKGALFKVGGLNYLINKYGVIDLGEGTIKIGIDNSISLTNQNGTKIDPSKIGGDFIEVTDKNGNKVKVKFIKDANGNIVAVDENGNIIDVGQIKKNKDGSIMVNGQNISKDKIANVNGLKVIKDKNGNLIAVDKNQKTKTIGKAKENNLNGNSIGKNGLSKMKNDSNLKSKMGEYVQYGEFLILDNNNRVFLNSAMEVIVISNMTNVENRGMGQLIKYPSKKYANQKDLYLLQNNQSTLLGTIVDSNIKDNTIYKTTGGMFYVSNNNINKLENNKLMNMNMVPKIEEDNLYGIDNNKNQRFLGKIIEIMTGELSKIKGNTSNSSNSQVTGAKTLQMVDENGNIKNVQIVRDANGNLIAVDENGNPIPGVRVERLANGKYAIVAANNIVGKDKLIDGKNFKLIKDKNGKLLLTDANGKPIDVNKLPGDWTEITDKNGKKVKVKFVKLADGRIVAVDENGNIVNADIKQNANGDLIINGTEVNDSDIGTLNDPVASYIALTMKDNTKNPIDIKKDTDLMSDDDINSLFATEKMIPKAPEPKIQVPTSTTPNMFNNNNGGMSGLLNKKTDNIKFKMVSINSPKAVEKNYTLYGKKNNMTKVTLGTGEIINVEADRVKTTFLPIGTKIQASLSGGALAAMPIGTANSKLFEDNIALFEVTRDITLADGTEFPISKAFISAEPIATSIKRMVFKLKSLHYYDVEADKWMISDLKGQVFSTVDYVNGIPGVVIDEKDKYLAKATVYSVLQGISTFLTATKSPLNSAQVLSGNGSLNNNLTQNMTGGASEAIKNLQETVMAMANAQVPILVVQDGSGVIIKITEPTTVKEFK